jgi:hypothetical protein
LGLLYDYDPDAFCKNIDTVRLNTGAVLDGKGLVGCRESLAALRDYDVLGGSM